MEELKCKSCGGKLKIGDNKKYAKCEYCNTQYELEDNNYTVNIKLDDSIKDTLNINQINNNSTTESSNFIKIFVILIFIAIALFSIFTFKHINDKTKDENNKFEITKFNSVIEMYNGTKSSFLVKSLLEQINTSNKTNERKITVIYDNKKILNSEEIIELKSSLENRDYEVVINYDNTGYIKEVEIR